MIGYKELNVYEAAQERISYVFDEFETIFVSVSSGKDSTVLYHLCLQEAIKRNKKINLFFLDQEAEYQGSIDLMREMMDHPNVIPWWFQVPIYMTNATSYTNTFLYAWGEGEEWVREKEEIAIKQIDTDYPKRFYDFFEWFEKQQDKKTAFLVGLRSKESLNRFRAISKNPGYSDVFWSTKTKNDLVFRFYPIYDWTFGDIWKFIDDNQVNYNRVYDKMYCIHGKRLNDIRISNLIHEKSFSCLSELQEIEPDTYEKICERIEGVHSAARYAKDKLLYSVDFLPKGFESWKHYRDYLLDSSPMEKEYKEKLQKRFDKTNGNIAIIKQQIRQVLLCDYENNVPVNTKRKSKEDLIREWWDVL